MSTGSESDESSSVFGTAGGSVMDFLRDRLEVPVLAAIVVTMLWIRLQSYERFIVDGAVLFSGNDAWYHLREVRYTVRNWPSTMPYDVWTNFPLGTSVGQFGTLYDQIVATVALIVGLGSPSPDLVAKILLVSPAVAGALTAIPVYYVGKRVAGKVPALFGAVVLMLIPGSFLRRTLVGAADHNGIEPLFQTAAVGAILLALAVGQRDRPIWELVTARDWDALRESAAYAALAGTAVGLYMWVWPPGLLLVGIFGVYVVFQAVSDYMNDRSPDHIAFVAAISMAAATGMSLLQLETLQLTVSKFGLLHPLSTLGVGGSAVGLAALARWFDGREFDEPWVERNGFAAVVATVVTLGILATATLDVPPFSTLRPRLLRFVGFNIGAAQRTIGEAQPFLSSGLASVYGEAGVVLSQYGFAFLTALAGVVWTLAAPIWNRNAEGDRAFLAFAAVTVLFVFLGNVGPDLFGGIVGLFGAETSIAGVVVIGALVFGAMLRVRYDAEVLFLVVWAAFLTMAAFTQVRFNYYLATSVAVFNAVFVKRALGVVNVELGDRVELPEIQTYQVLVVLAVIGLVLVPVLSVPLELGPRSEKTQTAAAIGNSTGPGQAVQAWDENLGWMQNNTPPEGTFAGADNRLEFYQTTPKPANADYAYPEGTYGVQSWWDYGHWITMRGERIPNANPFQEGATQAADFLLAPNESAAQDALTQRGDEPTRYVMVDWKMVSASPFSRDSKFTAPFAFTNRNVSASEYFEAVRSPQSGRVAFLTRNQPYYESMAVRLYMFHGSRAEPTVQSLLGERVIVFDYDTVRQQGRTFRLLPQGQNATAIRTFRNMSAAESFVESDGSAQIGGIGPYPRESVSALQHYRLVHVSDTSAFRSRSYQVTKLRQARALGVSPRFVYGQNPRWVKSFEKVPGVTVNGTGAEPNETVTASVRLRIPSTPTQNATSFTYRQQATADENGNFSFVLPYSTTGYENYGPDNGYTNVSVRATGPYSISGEIRSNESAYLLANSADLNVSEGLVNGDREGSLSVSLTEEVVSVPEGAQNGTSNTTSNTTTNGSAPLDVDLAGDAADATDDATDAASGQADSTARVGDTAAGPTADEGRVAADRRLVPVATTRDTTGVVTG